jgi:hypothetical protein
MSATTDDMNKLGWLRQTFGVSTSSMDAMDLARDHQDEGVQARAQGLEAESRQINIREANQQAQAVIQQMGGLAKALITLLGKDSPAAQALASKVKEEADARSNPAFSPTEPVRANYQQAKAEAGQALEALKLAIEQAKLAVEAEKQRRQQVLTQLTQRTTVEPLSKTADVLQRLAGKDGKSSDGRLLPHKRALDLAAKTSADSLSALREGQDLPLAEHDELARQCGLALDDEASKIQDAELQLQAKRDFMTETKDIRELLLWGESFKISGSETRLDTFREVWARVSKLKDWVSASTETDELKRQATILEQVKADREEFGRRKPVALQAIADAEQLFEEIGTLCARLEQEVGDVGSTYPLAGLLCAPMIEGQASTDQTALNFPDETDMVKLLADTELIRQRWQDLVNNAAPDLVKMRVAAAQRPLVSGSVVIPWSVGMKKPDVANALPLKLGNGDRVAGDIVNNAAGGQTGFKVGGRTVYHSSAGSGSVSDSKMGTAFWILQIDGDVNSPREIVAMGKHHGGQSDEYMIEWIASGANCPGNYIVKLNVKNSKTDEAKKLS